MTSCDGDFLKKGIITEVLDNDSMEPPTGELSSSLASASVESIEA